VKRRAIERRRNAAPLELRMHSEQDDLAGLALQLVGNEASDSAGKLRDQNVVPVLRLAGAFNAFSLTLPPVRVEDREDPWTQDSLERLEDRLPSEKRQLDDLGDIAFHTWSNQRFRFLHRSPRCTMVPAQRLVRVSAEARRPRRRNRVSQTR
jgi:hypothetical protein